MTAKIYALYEKELGILGNAVYVTYQLNDPPKMVHRSTASRYFDYVVDGKTVMFRIDNLAVTELIKDCCEVYKYD